MADWTPASTAGAPSVLRRWSFSSVAGGFLKLFFLLFLDFFFRQAPLSVIFRPPAAGVFLLSPGEPGWADASPWPRFYRLPARIYRRAGSPPFSSGRPGQSLVSPARKNDPHLPPWQKKAGARPALPWPQRWRRIFPHWLSWFTQPSIIGERELPTSTPPRTSFPSRAV